MFFGRHVAREETTLTIQKYASVSFGIFSQRYELRIMAVVQDSVHDIRPDINSLADDRMNLLFKRKMSSAYLLQKVTRTPTF